MIAVVWLILSIRHGTRRGSQWKAARALHSFGCNFWNHTHYMTNTRMGEPAGYHYDACR